MFEFFELVEGILLEDRIEGLKQKYPHDTVDFWAAHDPSKEKKYLPKVLQWHAKGVIKQEDHPRVAQALAHFNNPEVNKKLADRDIGKYKSLEDLESAVAPHVLPSFQGGSRIIHDSPELTVHEITTKKEGIPAMQRLGCPHAGGYKSTDSWCVKENPEAHWGHYERAGGSFYMIHDKTVPQGQEGYPNRHYLYHPVNDELAREDNIHINTELGEKHPVLNDIFHLQSSHFVSPTRLDADLVNQTKEKKEKLASVALKTKSAPVLDKLALHFPVETIKNEHAATSSQTLDRIIDSPEAMQKLQADDSGALSDLSYHDALSGPAQTKLLAYPETHAGLAQTATKPDLLHELSKSKREGVLTNVIANPVTRSETLEGLVDNTHPDVQHALIRNMHRIPVVSQLRMLHNSNSTRAANMARYARSPELLDAMLDHDNPTVVQSAIQNPSTKTRSLHRVLKRDDAALVNTTMGALRNRGHYSDSFLVKYADHPNPHVAVYVADQIRSPEVLSKLAGHKNINVVRKVAGNWKTPEPTFGKLLRHPDKEVVVNAATHTSDPKKLRRLARHPDPDVVKAAIGNTDMPSEVNKELLKHPNPDISHAAWQQTASYSDTPTVAQLRKWSKHSDPDTRHWVYGHSKTPEDVKAKMRKTQFVNVMLGKELKTDIYDKPPDRSRRRRYVRDTPMYQESRVEEFVYKLVSI